MGLWSKNVERSQTGEKRLENKSPFERYLEKVEWIDLGHDVLYPLYDFPLDYTTNEGSLISLDDIEGIISVLPEDITIMNKNHVKWLQDNCKIALCQEKEEKERGLMTSICCVNPKNHEFIYFNLDMYSTKQNTKYFLKNVETPETNDPFKNFYFKYNDMIEITEIGPHKFPSYLGTVKRVPVLKNSHDLKEYMIKVVKLK